MEPGCLRTISCRLSRQHGTLESGTLKLVAAHVINRCIFYSNEDAFDMMDTFREKAGPDANLQTLARGINVVALDSQPRDVIDLHAKMFKKHGMTTIRNFDALNDVNNLIDSGRSITNHGLNHEVCVTMMALPPGCTGAHDPEFYAKTLDDILAAEIPFTSVCFKDASGTAYPSTIFETVKAARKRLPEGTRLVYHTHDTAGTGVICYQAAIEAGIDQIDLSHGTLLRRNLPTGCGLHVACTPWQRLQTGS